jgi:hypothetical protein
MKGLYFIVFFVLLGNFELDAQVPQVQVRFLDYDDYQNEKSVDKIGIKKIIIKTGYHRADWEWYVDIRELDEKGRIIIKQQGSMSGDEFELGEPTVYEYHDKGLWQSKLIGNQMTTRAFVYNNKDELIEIKYSDGKFRKFHYDSKSRLIKAQYSDQFWNTYSYNDSLNQIETINIYHDSIFYEQKVYSYEENSYEVEIKNIFAHAPKDTVYSYEYFVYDKDTNLICHESKDSLSLGWESLIKNFRYQDDKLIEVTDYLTVQRTSGFMNYFYDPKGKFIKSEAFTQNGKLKTREVLFEYEY